MKAHLALLFLSLLDLPARYTPAQIVQHTPEIQQPPSTLSESIDVTTTLEPMPLSANDRSIDILETSYQPLLFNSVSDYLRLDSSLNVQARAGNGVQTDLSIRGTTFEQTLVLVNGFRLNDPESGHLNLDIPLPLEAISRIIPEHSSIFPRHKPYSTLSKPHGVITMAFQFSRYTLIAALALATLAGCLPARLWSQAAISPAPDSPRPTVLIELFTSEGCSDCPAADELLRQVTGRKDVGGPLIVGLSEHVSYWNGLGWRDPFSSDLYTARQNEYATRFALASVYTPQMIVNGREQFVGSDRRALDAALAAESKRKQIQLRIDSAQVTDKNITFSYSAGEVCIESFLKQNPIFRSIGSPGGWAFRWT